MTYIDIHREGIPCQCNTSNKARRQKGAVKGREFSLLLGGLMRDLADVRLVKARRSDHTF